MPWETGKAQRPGSPSVLRGLGRLTNVATELLPPSAGETQHPPPRPQQLGSSRWVSSCTFSDAWACDFCGTGHIFSSRSLTSSELHGTQAWVPVPVADSG